jgi:hypothetical protein
MLMRFYQSSSLDVQKIAQDLEMQYTADGFEVQSLGDSHQMIVQLKKENVVRFLLGFDKAIGITMERFADGFLVKIGAQDWADKAVAMINQRTAVSAIIGAIDQNKVVHQVMDALDHLVREQQPDVQWNTPPKGV